MGATNFSQVGHGESAGDAFQVAHDQAQWEYGHRGYTGSLAEKDDYVVTTDEIFPSKIEARAYADRLIRERDSRIDDKWGPAGAVRFADDEQDQEHGQSWLFFGWAPE